MKLLRSIAVFAITFYSLLFTLYSPAQAITPFAPFSVEGNPPEEYYFTDIFPLFRFIRPSLFKVYENQDRSRKYENFEICKDGDLRDYVCNNLEKSDPQADGCDGGSVNICYKGDRSGQVAHVANSKPNDSCSAGSASPPGTVGKCKYRKRPSVRDEPKATDFSEITRSVPLPLLTEEGSVPDPNSLADESATPLSQTTIGLIYAKLQNEQMRYSGVGTDNPITWGSHRLQLTQGEQAVKQLMVVTRAKQTKNTVAQTREWPLGWVDWGYKTGSGKTLIAIHDALPDGVSRAGLAIVESADDFFLNAGKLSIVSDVSRQKEYVAATVAEAMAKNPPPEWVTDLLQAPLYSPSFRQGYVRGSICIWNNCCPGLQCGPYAPFIGGNYKALYADTSVSQAFNAALDDLLLNYPLEEGAKIFNQLAGGNQLIRFAGSAAPNAVPSKIRERLTKEMSYKCLKYLPLTFTFEWFGEHMDYADPPDYLGGDKECPGYVIQPELTKERGGAVPQSLLARLINFFVGSSKVDDVEPVKKHLITIPDAMGQYLSEIEDPVFQIRDTLAENEKQNEYNKTLSNIIDATSDMLYAGKGVPVGDAKRRLGLFSCADPDYSSPEATGIEAYALGTRIGCFESQEPAGKCDPALFAKLLEDNGGLPTTASPEAEQYFSAYIKPNLTPELLGIYGAASAKTGVPCEVLAGIHFMEASLNPSGSLVSGRKLGTPEPDAGGQVFKDLLSTAIYAGEHLKGKVGGNIGDVKTLITALSRYNGGGNSNCQLGYPYPIPYSGCPRAFEGEDDIYPVSFLDDRHSRMYLLYCADRTACAPELFQRPGSFTVALSVYNNVTKNGSPPLLSSTPAPSSAPAPNTSSPGNGVQKTNPAGDCGAGYIDTGLGCLPYKRDALISALLGFIAGLSGLIALASMLFATFQIMTAGGNPEQLKKGKELFTAAVTGLLFVIFSVTLLRIIAGDIIKLPGF